jgi:hypothetical protein
MADSLVSGRPAEPIWHPGSVLRECVEVIHRPDHISAAVMQEMLDLPAEVLP